jgi:hypothetical protein
LREYFLFIDFFLLKNKFTVWKFYCSLTLFLGILVRWRTALKIHDFLPQNTGITHSRYLFFEDISGKSYSLSFKGEKFYKNQEPVIAAQKMVVSQEKGCHDC